MFALKNNKFSQWLESLLPIERKAVQVTAICAAVFLVVLIGTISTVAILSGGNENQPENSSSASYVNSFPLDEDELADTILAKTQDAGQEYLDETLFIGDSNTAALYEYGLLPLNQVAAKVGIGVEAALTDECCYFKDDQKGYTIVETVAKMKPRRVIACFGTNDAPYHTTEEFIASYREVLQAIEESYPYTDIIVSAVYPIARQNDYSNISMSTIDSYNQALAEMCKEDGYKFLNTTELLKGSDGYLQSGYANKDGIHLTSQALKAVLTYVREHAYETEDRRPDTSNIPERRKVAIASSSSSASLTASYYVEVTDGKTYGTLKGNGFENVTSQQFKVTEDANEFTVTAVPKEGYEFVKWSDGVTTATRTDRNITQNLSVTAVFRAQASITISASKDTVGSSGDNVTFTASVSGNRGDKTVVWQLNGQTISNKTGDSVTLNVIPGDKVSAVIGDTVSNTITIKQSQSLSIKAGASSCTLGQTVRFEAQGDGVDLDDVVWNIGGQQYTGRVVDYVASTAGNITVSASVEGVSASSVTLQVTAPATPTPSPTPTPNPTPGPTPTPVPTPEPSEPDDSSSTVPEPSADPGASQVTDPQA